MAHASTLLFQEYPEHMEEESTFSNSTMKTKKQANIFSLLRDSKNAKIAHCLQPAYVSQQLKRNKKNQGDKNGHLNPVLIVKRFLQFSLLVNLVGGNQSCWV